MFWLLGRFELLRTSHPLCFKQIKINRGGGNFAKSCNMVFKPTLPPFVNGNLLLIPSCAPIHDMAELMIMMMLIFYMFPHSPSAIRILPRPIHTHTQYQQTPSSRDWWTHGAMFNQCCRQRSSQVVVQGEKLWGLVLRNIFGGGGLCCSIQVNNFPKFCSTELRETAEKSVRDWCGSQFRWCKRANRAQKES